MNKLSIQQSKHWKWVFTNLFIGGGELICEVLWDLLTTEELEQDGIFSELSANSYRYDQNYYISPWENITNYINHSCAPNSYIEKVDWELIVRALTDIKPLSEVLIDYSTIMAPDDPRTMNCNCDNDNCRNIVLSYDKLPIQLQIYYKDQKIIPDYILAITLQTL